MELILERLSIRNFKGISSLDIDFGHETEISGDNGLGKTSVYDAVLWLLFGTDSQGRASFELKPKNKEGQIILGAEPEVTATIRCDGKPTTLRKQLREVWRKPTGQAQSIYDRDEVACYVNDVPKKIDKEYAPFIDSLIPERIFRFALVPRTFFDLPWDKRRKELIAIANPDIDGEVTQLPAFSSISYILCGETPEDAKKRIQDQRRKLNKDLDAIPARMDEIHRTLRPLDEEALADAEARKNDMEGELADIDRRIASGRELQKQIVAIISQQETFRKALQARQDALTYEAGKEAREARRKLEVARNNHTDLLCKKHEVQASMGLAQEQLSQSNQRRKELLDNWHEINNSPYQAPAISQACPTCGQQLPAAQIKAAHDKHRLEYQREKDRTLDCIQDEGKKVAARIAQQQAQIADWEAQISSLDMDIKASLDRIEALKSASQVGPYEVNYADDAECQRCTDEIYKLQSQLDGMDSANVDYLLKMKQDVMQAIQQSNAILAAREQSQQAYARLKELTQEKRDIGESIMTLDGELDLLDRYMSKRCELLEDNINRLFPTVRWKLFEPLKNGGIKDACTATVNGINIGGSANHAAWVNACIEVSRVICEHYGVSAPCFVDNAESINRLDKPAGQLITLRVTKDVILQVNHITKEDAA